MRIFPWLTGHDPDDARAPAAERPNPHTMIVGLLFVQLVLVLAILHREIVRLQFRNLATSFFMLVYAIVFVVEPLVLHLFFGGARSIVFGVPSFFTDPNVYYVFNCLGLPLLLTSLFFAPPALIADVSDASASPLERRNTDLSPLLGLSVCGGVLLFIGATGMRVGDLLTASRFEWFGAVSFSLFWLTVSSYFVALYAMFTYLVGITPRPSRLITLAAAGAIVLHALITKDRKFVIFFISGWLAARYETSGRRLTVSKRAMVTLAIVFVLIVISQFIRDSLFRYILGEPVDLVAELRQWQSFAIEFGDLSYFYRASLEAIHQNVNHGFLIPLALVRRIAFFFLPAGYSGGLKVEDISATFSDVVNGNDSVRRGNMPPGLFGLFVISFGWLGSVVAMPLLAVLLRKIDAMFRYGTSTFRQVVLAFYFFAATLAFRGDDSSAFYYVMSTFIFLLACRYAVTTVKWLARRPIQLAAARSDGVGSS